MPFLLTSRVAMLGLAAAGAACAVAFVLAGPLPRVTQLDSTYATSPTPIPGHENVNPAGFPKATFAAGCFWGVEAAFRKVPGVMATWVGYTGGHTVRPSYEQVCTHTTGHAEAVEVYFDPSKVSYDHLLDVFWHIHDPTTPNRQGPDIGSNYRSEIFTHSREQYKQAVASRQRLTNSGRLQDPIVTLIKPAGPFYPAERYHQCYDEKNGVSCPL